MHIEDLIEVERQLGLSLRSWPATPSSTINGSARAAAERCLPSRKAICGLAFAAVSIAMRQSMRPRLPPHGCQSERVRHLRWQLAPVDRRKRSSVSARTSVYPSARASTPAASPTGLVKTHCCFCGQQCGIQLKVKDNTGHRLRAVGRVSRSITACCAQRESSAICKGRTPTGC